MQKIPKEQLRKRFQILADTLQDVIFSENTSASIRKAAVLGDIEDKGGLLAEMTGLVLMGFLNPSDFQTELQKELGVTADIARQIESSLNAEIFSLVQTELKKLYPPTIKTPTVISGGFIPQSPKQQLGGSTSKLETMQPSMSEFEKRFFKPAVPATGEQKKTIPVPSFAPAGATADKPEDFIKARVPMSVSPTVEISKVQIPASPQIKPVPPAIPMQTPATPDAPRMKPVVPLPTYIQSQFQKRETSESQYREKMEEKTPPTQPKPQPKISGNVIDLRNVNK